MIMMCGNSLSTEVGMKGSANNLLGPRPNTCFTRGGKGLSSGMLVIRTQTLTLTRDWWIVITD